jgi:16S rRNA (guanine527-N7)-methyltransferase
MTDPAPPPLTAADFQSATGIAPGVFDRLQEYLSVLVAWQRRINLVGASTLRDPWRRHFLDSAQLAPLVRSEDKIVADIGSGAGFPGMVLAIMGVGGVHLIESNKRKCQFLREVAAATETPVHVHLCRAEEMPPLSADLVVARAVACLDRLLQYASRHLRSGGRCLFLKGRSAQRELTDAKKRWRIESQVIRSRSDPLGTVLRLEGIARRHDR